MWDGTVPIKKEKQNQIIKDIRDIYNDIDIMITNPPYPSLPEKVGKFFEKNHFEVEIIEYLGTDKNIIDYRVGKSGIVSFTHPDLNNAINKWNNYCYDKLKQNRLVGSKQGKQQINFILFLIFAFCAIIGNISLVLILLMLYLAWNYFIYPKAEENFVKKAQEDFDKMIEGAVRNYSSEDIKIAMSCNDKKYEENKEKSEIIHVLNNVIRKINSIEDNDMLIFTYNDKNINGSIHFYNIITDIKKNYYKRKKDISYVGGNQLEKDIIHYSNNFIKLLDLISQYKDKSPEINKEINEILTDHYVVFKHFNNTILGTDEIVDISKLKVIGKDIKIYKEFFGGM